MTTLEGAYTKAEQAAAKARDELEKANNELAKVEREAAAQRKQLTEEAWQAYADTFNPAALRQAVVDAEAELRRALPESPLGKALLGYVTAIARERQANDLAQSAEANGATFPGQPPRLLEQWQDANGRQIRSIEDWTPAVLPRVVATLALDTVKAESQAVQATVTDAVSKVQAPEVKWWKVTSEHTHDHEQRVGGPPVQFIGGIAYVPTGHGGLAYFRRRGEYQCTPVYGQPTSHAEAARRLAAEAATRDE